MVAVQEDGRYHALIVYDSINPKYQDFNLQRLHTLLDRRGFPSENVQTLAGDLSRNEVLESLDDLRGLSPEDRPAIFMFCHGIKLEGETYIGLSEGEISTPDLFASLEQIPGNKLVVPHCCYNGAVVDYFDDHDLEGDYVILGSCNADERTSHQYPNLISIAQLWPSTFALESVARKHPNIRADLATVKYSPGSIQTDIFGCIAEVLHLVGLIDVKAKIRSKRSSNSSYLF